jgi:hypothetical protein
VHTVSSSLLAAEPVVISCSPAFARFVVVVVVLRTDPHSPWLRRDLGGHRLFTHNHTPATSPTLHQ